MFCLLLLLLASRSEAYFETVNMSSRALSFGQSYVALATDVTGVTWNAAALAALTHYELQTTLSRPYFVPDLQSNSVLFGGPILQGAWGIGWHRIGNEFIAENLWFLSYGRWVYRGDAGELRLGGTLKVGNVSVDPGPSGGNYAGVSVGTMDLGLHYQHVSGVSVGAVLRNLGEPKVEFVPGNGGTPWKKEYHLGLAYRWRPESTISAGWASEGRQEGSWRMGGEIWFYDVFAVRLGLLGADQKSLENIEFAGGFGLKSSRWSLDSGFVTHAELGLSGRITLTLPFGKHP